MRTSLLVLLTAALMAFGASAASAAISIDESGTTIVLYDATLSNETVIGYDAGEVTVQNTDGSGFGVLLVPGGDCHFLSDNEVGCPVASFGDLDATYAGGRDQFHVELCGLPIAVDLGEGVNNYYGAECPGEGAIEVRGGSGQDTFAGATGGAQDETFIGGGGNDTLHGYGGDDDIRGGEGNDIADGGPGNDGVVGEGGNDVLTGDTGNDVEDGGPGDDNIGGKLGLSSGRDDDQGADTLRGGAGTDNLVLESHTGGVNITLDGQANDGAPGEGDNVASDFEHIDGTGADDVFTGSAGNDGFSGGGGADLIHGGDGADDLAGDGGGDRVFGDAGNDIVEGTNGADVVDGGPGADQIYGDIANCSVFCNFDADQLFARDGERDVVDCGGGADAAQVDSLDVVAFCSVVDRPGPPPGPGPGGGGRPGGRRRVHLRGRHVGQAQEAAQGRPRVPRQVRGRLQGHRDARLQGQEARRGPQDPQAGGDGQGRRADREEVAREGAPAEGQEAHAALQDHHEGQDDHAHPEGQAEALKLGLDHAIDQRVDRL